MMWPTFDKCSSARCTGGHRCSDTMEDAFKCFGDEDFDVKKWVNAQVCSSEALSSARGNAKGTNVDDHLATLVVKLQLLTQSSSKAIDEQSTVRPRCTPRPPSGACSS